MRSYQPLFEVIVVDDGSVDGTADIVEEYAKENPEVKLIRNLHRGKAAALITGVREAAGDLIYLADADLSTPISELKKLSVWIKDQDFDIVICSREGHGAQRIGEPAYRHLVGRTFNLMVQALALPGIQDSQCGFKLFKGDVAKRVFSKLKVYGEVPPEIKKPFFGALDVEVLFIARKLGYKIKEVPVLWTYVKTTRFNFIQNSAKMARDIILIRMKSISGEYR